MPSDKKERESMDDPIDELEFVLTKRYLKEFITFENDNRGVANVL